MQYLVTSTLKIISIIFPYMHYLHGNNQVVTVVYMNSRMLYAKIDLTVTTQTSRMHISNNVFNDSQVVA